MTEDLVPCQPEQEEVKQEIIIVEPVAEEEDKKQEFVEERKLIVRDDQVYRRYCYGVKNSTEFGLYVEC